MRETKCDVYTSLRGEITSLLLLPGTPLSIEDLCTKYGVSRSPVRDALLRLQRDKLVDIFPQKGTRVSFLDEKTVEEERFMRKCIELGVVEKCMNKERTEKEFSAFTVKLESNLLRQEASLLEEDYGGFYSSDDELHHLFYTEVELENLYLIVDAHTGNDRRIRMLSYSDPVIIEGVKKEHRALVDAIKRKDTESVLAIERMHLEKVSKEMKDFEEQYPAYFQKG